MLTVSSMCVLILPIQQLALQPKSIQIHTAMLNNARIELLSCIAAMQCKSLAHL